MSKDQKISLFQYRWNLPVIAELSKNDGSKFITLANRFQMSRAILQSTLDRLIEDDLVVRNLGHGHPLRPEYLLTPKGQPIGLFCVQLVEESRKQKIDDIFANRWTGPIIINIGKGFYRFNELKKQLSPITSRALSESIKILIKSQCLKRDIQDSNPPIPFYFLGKKAKPLYEIYKEHEAQISPCVIV